MKTTQSMQELKAERVQEELMAPNGTAQAQQLRTERVQKEARALMRKRLKGQNGAVGAALARTPHQAAERLKAERVQSRLQRLPRWKMLEDGEGIDRVRKFEDPLVTTSYLAFISLLARSVGQPLQVSLTDGNINIVLTGRKKGPDKGLTEEVLDLAEQLG